LRYPKEIFSRYFAKSSIKILITKSVRLILSPCWTKKYPSSLPNVYIHCIKYWKRHDIAEILLKVALNIITLTLEYWNNRLFAYFLLWVLNYTFWRSYFPWRHAKWFSFIQRSRKITYILYIFFHNLFKILML
jgi:hypothetical protein